VRGGEPPALTDEQRQALGEAVAVNSVGRVDAPMVFFLKL
jgi:hypothetical protein